MQICSCCESRPTPKRAVNPTPHQAPKCEQAPPQETVELTSTSPQPNLQALARQGKESAYQALLGGFTNFSAASIPEIFQLAKEHQPEAVTHVLYHGGCRDGRTAAWAAYKKLGDQAEYIPMGYQAPPPDLPPDARVAVVDFSFLPDVLDELKKKVADVVILDHHDTAAERLTGVPGVVVDQERAGAGLSWHYFHPDKPLPALVAYAEDRDLWRFDLPLSKEVGTAMGVAEWDGPKSWDKLDIETLKRDGVEMTAFMDEQNQRMLDLVQWGDIAGHKAPAINTNLNVDELASVVFEKYPQADFIATYYDTAGARKWSLRSRTDFEVNHIAAQFGGGGHPAAAGFKEMGKKAPEVRPPEQPAHGPEKLMTELDKSSDAVRRFAAGQVERALGSSFVARIDGQKVPVVNCPFNREELGQAMLAKYPDAPMVGVYYTTASGDRHWSLYSREDSQVAAIAAKFGGQGGARSAVFVEGRSAAARELVAEPKQ